MIELRWPEHDPCHCAPPEPEEFAAASVPHLFPRRHAHVRETLEIMQGIWSNELFEYHGGFADFPLSGFGHKPLQHQPHDRSVAAR